MNTIKLEKGIIYHSLPFRLGPGKPFEFNNIETDIWTKTDENLSMLDAASLEFHEDAVKRYKLKSSMIKD